MTGQAKNTAKKRAVKANTNRANEWDITAQCANLRQPSARGKAAGAIAFGSPERRVSSFIGRRCPTQKRVCSARFLFSFARSVPRYTRKSQSRRTPLHLGGS